MEERVANLSQDRHGWHIGSKPGCGSRAVIIEDDKERSDRRGSPAGPRCRISEV